MKRTRDLPPYVYSNRPGGYQIMVTVAGERLIIMNTTKLEEAELVSKMIQAQVNKVDKQKAKLDKQLSVKLKNLRGYFIGENETGEDTER